MTDFRNVKFADLSYVGNDILKCLRRVETFGDLIIYWAQGLRLNEEISPGVNVLAAIAMATWLTINPLPMSNEEAAELTGYTPTPEQREKNLQHNLDLLGNQNVKSGPESNITNFKHTPEEARELVAQALESGDFEQGVGRLYNCDGTCDPLGVSIRVFMDHEEHNIKIEPTHGGNKFNEEAFYLLPEVKEWLGFSTCRGHYNGMYNSRDCSLTIDNDKRGLSFEQIAKLFRNPPEGLLV